MNDRIKNIFVIGLFPDKNSAFLNQLCRYFTVFIFRQHYFGSQHNHNVRFVEDVVGASDVSFPWDEFSWELHRCLSHAENTIAEHFPSRARLNRAEFESLYRTAFQCFLMAKYFRKLSERKAIDFVIANADCSAVRRAIVLEAKDLGIPTLNLEHGFNHAVMPSPTALAAEFIPNPMFVSDYVNLDNKMEEENWNAYFSHVGLAGRTQVARNGTPNDESFDHNLSRLEARRSLGVKEDAFTVTLIGTWNEARDASVILKGLAQEARFYNTTLEVLAKITRTNPLQVLIKLHPAYSHRAIFSDVTQYLSNLGRRLEVEIAHVSTGHLSEITAASDLVISPTDSSVLWESFLVPAPGIIFPANASLTTFYKAELLNESNELTRRGCLRYVFDKAQLESAIRFFMDSANRRTFETTAQDLKTEYGISLASAEEKSQRVCQWIERILAPKSTATDPGESPDIRPVNGQVDWLFETGRKFLESGDVKQGLAMLTKVLELDPAHYPTLRVMAELYEKLGDSVKAQKMQQLAEKTWATLHPAA